LKAAGPAVTFDAMRDEDSIRDDDGTELTATPTVPLRGVRGAAVLAVPVAVVAMAVTGCDTANVTPDAGIYAADVGLTHDAGGVDAPALIFDGGISAADAPASTFDAGIADAPAGDEDVPASDGEGL
jgi:hypothetical protein